MIDPKEQKLEAEYQKAKTFLQKTVPQRIINVAKERIENRKLEANAPSTGYKMLDRLIKGFIPGHLYTVTGHTNVGKTSISANFAYNVASQGKRVLYFSLEPADMIVEYLVSVRDAKPFSEITDDDLLKPLPPIDIFNKDNISCLNDVIEAIKHNARYDLIIIDHLGYFTRGEKLSVNQEQSNAVKQLVQMAKKFKTAVMQIVHVNKSTQDVPTMANISGSAALYQDSTEVIIVIRNKDESSNEMQKKYLNSGYMLVEKTKCGPSGYIPIEFMPLSSFMVEGNLLEKNIREALL